MTLAIGGIDHVVVMARDIEASLGFYRDLLGGETRYETAFGEGRVQVIPVVLGTVTT